MYSISHIWQLVLGWLRGLRPIKNKPAPHNESPSLTGEPGVAEKAVLLNDENKVVTSPNSEATASEIEIEATKGKTL